MAFIVAASKYRGPQAKGYIVISRDAAGQKVWQSVATLAEAKATLAKAALAEQQPRRRPAVAPSITVAAYFTEFLKVHGVTLKTRTVNLYTDQLRRYIAPAFGATRVRSLQRSQIKRWLADLLRRGLDRDTVRIAYSALHTMLNHAVEDELIGGNPASKLGRSLKLLAAPGERQARVKAMDREQLQAFLEAMRGPQARPADQRYHPFFLTLARTGLRIGEAFALEPGDIDFTAGTIRVERALRTAVWRRRRRPCSRFGLWTCPAGSLRSFGSWSRRAEKRASGTGGRRPGYSSLRRARR